MNSTGGNARNEIDRATYILNCVSADRCQIFT